MERLHVVCRRIQRDSWTVKEARKSFFYLLHPAVLIKLWNREIISPLKHSWFSINRLMYCAGSVPLIYTESVWDVTNYTYYLYGIQRLIHDLKPMLWNTRFNLMLTTATHITNYAKYWLCVLRPPWQKEPKRVLMLHIPVGVFTQGVCFNSSERKSVTTKTFLCFIKNYSALVIFMN
jgi:hypothetical protein